MRTQLLPNIWLDDDGLLSLDFSGEHHESSFRCFDDYEPFDFFAGEEAEEDEEDTDL